MPISRPSSYTTVFPSSPSDWGEITFTRDASFDAAISAEEALYQRLLAEGRRAIYDGRYTYEYLSDGSLVRVSDDELRAEPAKKGQVLDAKAIQYELEDCLLHLMKGQPGIMTREYISCEQTLGDVHFQHNYQRQAAENQQMYYIKYKGKKLAIVQRYPHKRATIFQQSEPKYLLVQRLLERVLYYSLPEAKVEVL